jgi:hypothetical protein
VEQGAAEDGGQESCLSLNVFRVLSQDPENIEREKVVARARPPRKRRMMRGM